MEMRITARHFDLSPEIKDYVGKRTATLDRYEDLIVSMHMILGVEKRRSISEMTVHVSGHHLVAQSVTDDIYKSIDETTDKMERQIRKLHERVTDYK